MFTRGPNYYYSALFLEILELWIGGWQCTRDGCTKTFECIFLKFCSSKKICMTKPLKATAHVYMYFSYEFNELFSSVKTPNEWYIIQLCYLLTCTLHLWFWSVYMTNLISPSMFKSFSDSNKCSFQGNPPSSNSMISPLGST